MVTMRNELYGILRLLYAKGIGQKKALHIIKSITEIGSSIDELINNIDNNSNISFLDPKIVTLIKDSKEKTESIINKLDDDFVFIPINSALYPQKLKYKLGSNAPIFLFCKGNLKLFDEPSVGFCGSREATNKGIIIVEEIIKQVPKNIVNISGYAKGIDMKVHSESLKHGHPTIIVLPYGHLNFKIKEELINIFNENNVLVVSEFLPDSIWSVGNAMQRNSTVVALSNIMVLIEAKRNGGSLDAGKKAIEMNVPIFAPVYAENSRLTEGNKIIQEMGGYPIKKNRNTNLPNISKIVELLPLAN